MSSLLRFAFGSVQPKLDVRAPSWALLRLLQQMDFEVQSFRSRGCFPPHEGAHVATGHQARHLDSWTMSSEVCRELMLLGTEHADVAIVEGAYDCSFHPRRSVMAGEPLASPRGGSLDQLCEWLHLPRLVVLDVREFQSTGIPQLPPQVDGFFLDGVSNVEELYRYKTDLEAIHRAPVIGSLSPDASLRAALAALPTGTKPPSSLCNALAHNLSEHFWPEVLLQVIDRAEGCSITSGLLNRFVDLSDRRVAVAYDDAFHCYFPDTLELLEKLGATMIDFSPLSCESVPTDVDVVYFGGGPLEQHAAELSNNCCLRQTLKQHVRQGGLVYAECSAAGYLCEELVVDHDTHRMVGLLPAIARYQSDPSEATPTETMFTQDCWLGKQGDELRGYRNNHWQFECQPAVEVFSRSHGSEPCLMGLGNVLASPMHVQFAAQPARLQRFCHPNKSVIGALR